MGFIGWGNAPPPANRVNKMKNVTVFENVKELKDTIQGIRYFISDIGGAVGAAELDGAARRATAERAKYQAEAMCPRASEALLEEFAHAVRSLDYVILRTTSVRDGYAKKNSAFIVGEFGSAPEFKAKGFEHNGMMIVASDEQIEKMMLEQDPSLVGLTMLRTSREGQEFAFIKSGFLGSMNSKNREFYIMTRQVQ
jgi:hypothetical protein